MSRRVSSWGGMSNVALGWAQPAFSSDIKHCVAATRRPSGEKCLVIGNTRSYGDEVLSPAGHYIQTTRCDRILHIHRENDQITVECGTTIDAIQRRLASMGYFLPVTPGTAFLTVGGAIANDVHGKNHHIAGTFGRYVEGFELVRSSGETLFCSRTENPEYFAATIGGMGLTGAITWATLKLRRIVSPLLTITSRRFGNLKEFFDIDDELSAGSEYAVAWVDCLASGRALGRGIYSSADHSNEESWTASSKYQDARSLSIPFAPPVSPVNHVTLHLFNSFYYRAHRTGSREIHFKNWLYPLDSLKSWNRLYGKRGFYQFQCVVPSNTARTAIPELLKAISFAGQGSFLAVLKNFGDQPSPGLMSFPLRGTTLALDFPNLGAKTRDLLLELYDLTAAAGGRLYPAKDGCSPEHSLRQGYPNFARFKQFIDPGIESRLAQRQQLCT